MIPAHPPIAWIAFASSIVFLLAIELGVISRVKQLSVKQAAWWTATVVVVAMVFGVVLLLAEGRTPAVQFATGYVVEFSLSVDNLLVFIMVLHYFAVPDELQPLAIKWGILGAIVMRAIMILGGTLILNELAWIIYVLGALLIVTGLRMLRQPTAAQVKIESNPLLRALRRVMPVTDQFAGPAFFVQEAGRRMATPLLLVVLVIEWTDLMFATDSIPAIFAITRDPFLVYTSNILAIVGLRALFFVLAASIARFAYLRFGVAAVLVLVGAKMLAAHYVHIPAGWSLAMIVVVLGISVVASLLRTRDEDQRTP
jgi:tellurite resistance protein TerC